MIIFWDGYYTGNAYLSLEQMQVNAKYIYDYYIAKGWTANAICGMLGNMQVESTINPGIWESLNDYPDGFYEEHGRYPGYGLVQWTPYTIYFDWCTENFLTGRELPNNLARIDYELANGLQWISTVHYPMSFEQFTKSSLRPDTLASVFMENYERAGVLAELERQTNANYWYKYLTGNNPSVDPDDPTPTKPKKKKGYNFVLFNKKRRIYG